MARLIDHPVLVASPGTPPKQIAEYVGRVSSADSALSVAVMDSPAGWTEPGQRPEFDEYTVVLRGVLLVETAEAALEVTSGQAVHAPAGEWVRYSTPAAGGAHYVSVCLPAFSPESVHRDANPAGASERP
jgi:mannose-6-phosphate isomerase-like protein (cupin superfamily)